MKMPKAFTERMKHLLGAAYGDFEAALNKAASVSVRLNPMKHAPSFADSEPLPWCKHGLYLHKRPVFTLDPLWHAGAYYVQEASSMLIEQFWHQHVTAETPLRVLDLCAAPGGKSTHLLSLMNSQSVLVSNEVIPKRNAVLRENIIKWGAPNVIVTQSEAGNFASLPEFFDVVLVDAPCSGEGLWRKDSDAVNEWSEDAVERCAIRQSSILADVLPSLKAGGLLIYCTCTYADAENMQQLVKLRHEFESLRLKTSNDWGVAENEEDGVWGYHCYPHKVRGEGFFIGAMRKRVHMPGRVSRQQLFHWRPTETYLPFLEPAGAKIMYQHNSAISLVTFELNEVLRQISPQIAVRYFGTEVAEVSSGGIVPTHPLAVSTLPVTAPDIQLDLEAALQYLRCFDLPPSTANGQCTVSFDGCRLGWVNAQPHRTRNRYPKNWRIRI